MPIHYDVINPAWPWNLRICTASGLSWMKWKRSWLSLPSSEGPSMLATGSRWHIGGPSNRNPVFCQPQGGAWPGAHYFPVGTQISPAPTRCDAPSRPVVHSCYFLTPLCRASFSLSLRVLFSLFHRISCVAAGARRTKYDEALDLLERALGRASLP